MNNFSDLDFSEAEKQKLLDEIQCLREELTATKSRLNRRNQLQHSLSNAMHIGYWEWDTQANCPGYLSVEMAEIMGMSLDSLYEQYRSEEDFFKFIHPDDEDHIRSNMNVILDNDRPQGEVHIYDYRIIRPDGEVRQLLELEYGLLEENGVVTRIYGAIQDITDHQKLNLALKRSEQRYSSLFSKLPLGVQEQDWSIIKRAIDKLRTEGVTDLRYYLENMPLVLRELVESIEIVSANDALLKIYGSSSVEEYIAGEEDISEWWDDKWANLYLSEFVDLDGPDGIHDEEIEEEREDGSLFELRMITSVVKGDEDTWSRVLTIIEDVSGRKESELALLDAIDKAQKASLAKTEFLASMSHELRTPMNAIIGFGQLLEATPAEPLGKKQQTAVAHILRAGEHMMDLIKQVLELNNIESRNLPISFKEIPAQDIIEDCLQLTQALAIEKNIQIVDNTSKENLPVLWTDRTRLIQAIINLISNAIKYNRKGGTVTLSCESTSENMFRILVTDTGLGIQKRKQTDLFKPFERLGLENGPIEGTGIGLTLSKQLIELLGGQIGLWSQEGRGSTFWIDVPTRSEKLTS